MINIKTTPSGSAPFANETGAGTVRVLNGSMCSFSIGGDIADIPTADFSIACELSDFIIYGNGNTVAVIAE